MITNFKVNGPDPLYYTFQHFTAHYDNSKNERDREREREIKGYN